MSIRTNLFLPRGKPFFSFLQPNEVPLATSTPKVTRGKGYKINGKGKGKEKAIQDHPELNIQRLPDSDDDFIEPKNKKKKVSTQSLEIETAFYNHLRKQGVDDKMMESEL